MTIIADTETQALEDGDAFYDAHHVNLLHIIKEARDREKAARAEAEAPAALLKSYLQERDEPVLYDEERGLKAFLQERSGTEWDLRGMDYIALHALCDAGLLKVDNAAFDALRKVAPAGYLDEAAKFRRQIVGSVAMFVEKVGS